MKKFISNIILLVSIFILTACTVEFGDAPKVQITDFHNRSVLYGWIDINDVKGSNLNQVSIFQFQPSETKGYRDTRIIKFNNGFIYYSVTIPNGEFKPSCAITESPFGPSLYRYCFLEKEDDSTGALKVTKPSVYFLGSNKLTQTKYNFLTRRGKFEFNPALNSPAKKDILQAILKDSIEKNDSTVIIDRIKHELEKTK